MVTLIIAIISIALIVAVVAASSYFGGDTLNDARAQAEATRLKNEEQQILAGMDVFNADRHRWPNNVQELVDTGYLISIPHGVKTDTAVGAAGLAMNLIPAAHAAEHADFSGWSMPRAQQPIFWTSTQVEKVICQKYNFVSRGDNGILRKPFAELSAQCFGEDGRYQVLVRKASSQVLGLGDAIPDSGVQEGGLPTSEAGSSWWDTEPSSAVKGPVDPDKKPYAKLVLATSSIPLGNVQVGRHAKSSSLTVTNQGNTLAASIAVSAPEGFSVVDSTCGSALSVGGSCSFAVGFAPTEAREYVGTIEVQSANGGTQNAQAAGTGVAAEARLTGVSFGALPAGTTLQRDAIVENTGIDVLQLGAPFVSGSGFSLVAGGTCTSSLAAGASCSIKVQLEGEETTQHVGKVTINTDAGLKTAALMGQSQQALISVTPAAYSFADTELGKFSTSGSHTIKNTGNLAQVPLTIQAPPGFSLSNNTCATTLAAGSQCSVSLQFSPTLATRYEGTATVSGSPGIALSGQGIRQIATITNVDLTQVPFGSSGTANAFITNTGNIPLTITAITSANVVGPGFSLYGTTCGATLAAGSSCSVVVNYAASNLTTNTGALTVTYGGGSLQATLTGKGVYSGSALQYTGPVFGGGGAPDITAAAGTWGKSSSAFRFINLTGTPLANVKIAYANTTYFRTGTSTCGTSIGAGEACTFYVQFYSASKSSTISTTMQVTATGYSSNTQALRGTSY